MRLAVLMYCCVLVFCSQAQVPNSWDSIADFPSQRTRGVGFSLLDKGYVCTGLDTADLTHNDLWEYDPVLGSWSQKASLPGAPRRNAVGFTIGNFAYVGTGADSSSAPGGQILKDFWKYDPVINSWSQIADYPGGNGNGVYFAAAFSSDEKGYVIGGKLGPDTYTDQLWEYKPFQDVWAPRAAYLGGPRYQLVSTRIGNKVIVGLGGNEDIYTKDLYAYHLATNTWEQLGDFPSAERGGAIAYTIKNQAFIALGTDGGYRDDVWEYNPSFDTWLNRNDYPGGGRKFCSYFVIEDSVYVGIGKSTTGKKRGFYKYIRGEAPLQLSEVELQNLQLYPNPINENRVFVKNDKVDFITLYSIAGKEIARISKGVSGFQLPNDLNSGTYIVYLEADTNVVSTQKIQVLK
ncbi:MAG: Kelch repeat-containing protein [Lishizhenia sp.]